MRRPDLLVLVAAWNFFAALALFIGALAILFLAYPAASAENFGVDLTAALFGITVGLVVVLVLLGLHLAAGIGVLAGREWGRVLAIITAALILPGIPFGTVIGVLILVYLFRPEVKGYFLRIPPPPPPPRPA